MSSRACTLLLASALSWACGDAGRPSEASPGAKASSAAPGSTAGAPGGSDTGAKKTPAQANGTAAPSGAEAGEAPGDEGDEGDGGEGDAFEDDTPVELPVYPDLPPPEPEPPEVQEAIFERTGELGLDLIKALERGDIDAALTLTPYGEGEWSQLCEADALEDGAAEARARLNHCAKLIDWPKVQDVRIGGGEASSQRAPGCKPKVAGFERVLMLAVQPGRDVQLELRGVYGREGKAEAFSGNIECRRVE